MADNSSMPNLLAYGYQCNPWLEAAGARHAGYVAASEGAVFSPPAIGTSAMASSEVLPVFPAELIAKAA
jgi:hypothetical protein